MVLLPVPYWPTCSVFNETGSLIQWCQNQQLANTFRPDPRWCRIDQFTVADKTRLSAEFLETQAYVEHNEQDFNKKAHHFGSCWYRDFSIRVQPISNGFTASERVIQLIHCLLCKPLDIFAPWALTSGPKLDWTYYIFGWFQFSGKLLKLSMHKIT